MALMIRLSFRLFPGTARLEKSLMLKVSHNVSILQSGAGLITVRH